MNDIERGRRAPGETGLDHLLRDFFESEMPFELRRHTGAQQRASGDPADPSLRTGWRRKRTLWGLTAVAACLLVVVAALSLPLSTREADSSRSTAARPSTDSANETAPPLVDAPSPVETAVPELEVTVFEDSEVIEYYETADGPVEQRSKLRIRNVSIYLPQSGSKVDVTLPELDIEIFPIKDD